jgi:serine/threonine-protein kinase
MSERPARIGDYQIEDELGAGGMATVYRARHVFLDTVHALKVLDPVLRARPEARQRFLDEARIQAKHLLHPNIVKVSNIVATAEHAALVMELVDGGSLEAEVGALRERPDEVRRLMLAVLDAVGHAHAAGIIHRDLKPANVLLARDRGPPIPKVTDFGIAKVSTELAATGKRSTQGDSRMGTLGYMSPEQVRRARDVTARSDIFSLGAMLYELATGAVAFAGDSDYDVMENVVNGRYPPPESVYPAIDRGLAAVIRKALAPDPADRYASCADMAAALRGGEAGRAATAPTTAATTKPAAPRADDGAGRHRRALLIGGVAIAGLAIAVGALVLTRDDAGDRPASGSGSGTASGRGSGSSAPVTIIDATSSASPDTTTSATPATAAAELDAGPGAPAVPLVRDGGSHARLEALLAGTATAPPPPPPNPCRGTRFFNAPAGKDWTIAVTGRSTGTCGDLYMYDRTVMKPGVRTCHSPLRNCTVTGKKLTASFACDYNVAPTESRRGTLTLTCGGGRVTVVSPYGIRTSN